jgi:formylmethanofuran dehydrogenase subunit E
MATKNILPEWVFEFHGHRCPFVPIGYRMGPPKEDVERISKKKVEEISKLAFAC